MLDAVGGRRPPATSKKAGTSSSNDLQGKVGKNGLSAWQKQELKWGWSPADQAAFAKSLKNIKTK